MHIHRSMIRSGRVLLGALLIYQLGAAGALLPEAHAQDWEVESGDKRQQEILRRYLELLEKTPTEGFVFDKVLESVGRGKGLDNLIRDYQKKADARPEAVNYRLILGHLLKAKNDYEAALAQYDQAVEFGERNPTAWLSRGSAHMLLGQQKEATADFERALELETDRDKKQEILRNLADTSFAQHDWERAEKYYDQLIEMSPRDEYLRMEYAQVLMKYRRYDKALEQYDALLRLAGSDSKKRATTLRDKGEVLDQMGRSAEALKLYEQAMGLMRLGNWLYSELQQRVIGAYRNMDKLDELLADLSEKWRAPNFEQAMILADLYDELGDEEQALKFYRQASAKNTRDTAPRLKVIEILKRRGEDQEVVKAYQQLLAVAGNQHRFHFELVQLYFRMGERQKAEQALARIKSRFSSDAVVYLELADTYTRFDMREDAQNAYERLVRIEPRNPNYILSLGEFYYQQGEVEKAKRTWQKILDSHLEPYESYTLLGDTYAEHGMVEQGIDYYRNAVELAPDDLEVRQGLALNYVRARRWEEAVEIWQEVLDQADSAELRAQARGRIISIHEQRGVLTQEIDGWRADFEAEEPDLQAGYFLAESLIHRRDYERAERAYQQLIELEDARGEEDGEAMSSLLRVYQQTGQSEKAIALLEELAERRPKLAQEYYRQITDLAVELYQDDKAVEYAQRAVEQNPDDARAREHLADVYRQMQRFEPAIEEYKKAVDLDPRGLEPAQKLADLYMKLGEFQQADDYYRQVVKRGEDEALILEAGRASIRLARADQRLKELELEFSPLVFQARAKPVYRKLMLELYELMITPLAQELRWAEAPDEALAAELEQVSRSSMPVLLDALHSSDVGERALAVQLLGDAQAGPAAAQLARIAVDVEDSIAGLAAISVAMIADDRASKTLIDALNHAHPGVRDVATWALGFSAGAGASAALAEVLSEGQNASQRDLAALSLGRINDQGARSALQRASAGATKESRAPSAALIWAFGEAQIEAALPALKEVLLSGPREAAGLAAWSLSRLPQDAAFAALLDALWGADSTRREAARRGLAQLAARHSTSSEQASAPRSALQAGEEMQYLDAINNEFKTKELMARLYRRAQVVSGSVQLPEAILADKNHAKILEKLGAEEPAVRRHVLQDLVAAMRLDGEESAEPEEAQRALAGLTPKIRELAESAALSELRPALWLLAMSAEGADYERVQAAAQGEDARVRAAALSALAQALRRGARADIQSDTLREIFERGAQDADFSARAAAAEGLGIWASAQEASADSGAELLAELLADDSALVRQAAARGLVAIGSERAISLLEENLSAQPIVVQLAALRELTRREEPAAQKILEPYKAHPNARLRQAATLTD